MIRSRAFEDSVADKPPEPGNPLQKPRPGNRTHRVILCVHASPEKRTKRGTRGVGGGQRRLWAFSFLDLAKLLDVKPRTVHALVRDGKFDPRDLASIVAYYDLSRKPRKRARKNVLSASREVVPETT